jgi:aspartokinase
MQELQTFAVVVVRNGSAVLSVVAPAIGPHLIGEIGDALASARIALRGISMAGSVDGDAIAPQSCQFVIADSDVEVAVRTLHAAFFEL